jgi:hypothetical protein
VDILSLLKGYRSTYKLADCFSNTYNKIISIPLSLDLNRAEPIPNACHSILFHEFPPNKKLPRPCFVWSYFNRVLGK